MRTAAGLPVLTHGPACSLVAKLPPVQHYWFALLCRDLTKADAFDLVDGNSLQTAMMTQKFDQARLQVRRPCTGLPWQSEYR